MTRRHVTVTMTEAEAHALWRLAECAANTWDDAESVLVDSQKVRAGFRGIAKLRAAIAITAGLL